MIQTSMDNILFQMLQKTDTKFKSIKKYKFYKYISMHNKTWNHFSFAWVYVSHNIKKYFAIHFHQLLKMFNF